ncbi:alpha/beta-hydrolase [Heliocybe sulcata]|uniref:Alpha/beta-hydrolase n=1 Tax=Heliocybe sulcata TaxID=5364 RepID=A0A5C3MQG7_9AGAM|nr:alpha/beta-hydrolase [Heliocybe sulcata]
MMALLSVAVALAVGAAVDAAPSLRTRQSITTLSSSQVSAYTPYSWYASAGYCEASATLTWTCGTNCEANSGFQPVASGGDGSDKQYWFVGYDPSLDTVIVSHQGTDPSEILPLITDADIDKTTLDSTLFPGISSSIEVHAGFAESQADSATDVLAAVKSTLSTYGTSTVTLVGHSLGGAISLLDLVYLPLHLPSGLTYQMFGYGLPRVGNQAFADYIDANHPITHINNEEDYIPILPGRFLGFVHPSGEVHIQDSGSWDACPGQDNPSTLCIVGDVPEIWDGHESDHDGPYGPVEMGCKS